MIVLYILLYIAGALTTIYFIVKSRELRKFLAGAFFVSGGILFYLHLVNVSIPLVGTDIVQTPQMAAIRCVPHFIFSGLCFYFGYIKT